MRHRRERVRTAHGPSQELRTQLAAAWGYLAKDDAAKTDDQLDCIAAMTWRRLTPKG